MESSRIFVRGLPPTITEAQFREHFSRGEITDCKVIPQRRIGFVGYRTAEQAQQAVKYFNRSFIRMSKISVELAKPVADPSLTKVAAKAKKQVKQHQDVTPFTPVEASVQTDRVDSIRKKRKRETTDESDVKLQEYLSVMLPASKNAKLGPEAETQDYLEQPKLDEGDSDDEYEEVPKRLSERSARQTIIESVQARQKPPGSQITPNANGASDIVLNPVANGPSTSDGTEPGSSSSTALPTKVNATDDDWLRSRTNRLLDLVDDDEPMSEPQPQQLPVEQDEDAAPATEVIAESDSVVESEDGTAPTQKSAKDQTRDSTLETIRSTRRLFLRNLPYSASEDDIRSYVEKFGEVEEVHVPLSSASANNKGFAFVLFATPASAEAAFLNADGSTFQGRILHILAASAKRDKLDEFALSKLPLKQQNALRKRAEAATSRFNWNSLFMSTDAVNASVADRLGISKAELLDPTNADAGVKQALAETSVIQQTKAYFIANGVDLDSFKSSKRGDTSILVKGFEYGTTIEEIRSLFEEHGQVLKVLMPPTGTIAIVQFAKAPEAKSAFTKLAYRRFKSSILYLEKAPKNLFVSETLEDTSYAGSLGVQKLSAADLLERTNDSEQIETSSLFVKNLSFDTTTSQLAEVFKDLEGFRSALVKVKSNSQKAGQVLSMGFGFVEFNSKGAAEAALKIMDGYVLDGHRLQVRASHRGHDAAEERRREDIAKKLAGQRTKVVIKNLPFEATKRDLRQLLGSYGQLRTVRIPKNINSRSKGFGFAEFATSREAEQAVSALKDTHLLGRKLVLEFAEAELIDPEEEIEKMARKVGGQVNKVALQQLTGRGRKKVTLGKEDEDEGDL